MVTRKMCWPSKYVAATALTDIKPVQRLVFAVELSKPVFPQAWHLTSPDNTRLFCPSCSSSEIDFYSGLVYSSTRHFHPILNESGCDWLILPCDRLSHSFIGGRILYLVQSGVSTGFPLVDARPWDNFGLMLVHRLRRWTNIKPTLVQCFVFVGAVVHAATCQILK